MTAHRPLGIFRVIWRPWSGQHARNARVMKIPHWSIRTAVWHAYLITRTTGRLHTPYRCRWSDDRVWGGAPEHWHVGRRDPAKGREYRDGSKSTRPPGQVSS